MSRQIEMMETNTQDINILISLVRNWQRTLQQYQEAVEQSPDKGTRERQERLRGLDYAAEVVTGNTHEYKALAYFVMLVDEIERLQK